MNADNESCDYCTHLAAMIRISGESIQRYYYWGTRWSERANMDSPDASMIKIEENLKGIEKHIEADHK